MNSPPRPIANSATSNNTWSVLAWAILCLRVSCTSSTTGSVLQNMNNLLSSGQEELRQNTVMPTESVLMNIESETEPGDKVNDDWIIDRKTGRYNSSFEIPLKNYQCKDNELRSTRITKGGAEERRGVKEECGVSAKVPPNNAPSAGGIGFPRRTRKSRDDNRHRSYILRNSHQLDFVIVILHFKFFWSVGLC
jgi:hypothetical protein